MDISVDGGYTQWTSWSVCPVTCGGSTHTRTRSCTAPTPQNGGRTCIQQGLGVATENEACNTNICGGMRNKISSIPFKLSYPLFMVNFLFVAICHVSACSG